MTHSHGGELIRPKSRDKPGEEKQKKRKKIHQLEKLPK